MRARLHRSHLGRHVAPARNEVGHVPRHPSDLIPRCAGSTLFVLRKGVGACRTVLGRLGAFQAVGRRLGSFLFSVFLRGIASEQHQGSYLGWGKLDREDRSGGGEGGECGMTLSQDERAGSDQRLLAEDGGSEEVQ